MKINYDDDEFVPEIRDSDIDDALADIENYK